MWGLERIAFHEPMLSQKPWGETMIWQEDIGIPMRSFRSACKKLCTVSAGLLKNEQIRTVLPKPGSGKTWGRGQARYPIRRFLAFQRIEKPRK